MTQDNTANAALDQVLAIVTDLLRERGTETGANIGHELRKQIPAFNPRTLGFEKLSQLLLQAADELVVVGRKGEDRIWALGESVSDRELEHALGAETDAALDVPQPVMTRVSGAEFVNFRSCHQVRLELSDGLTALVGPNGSGKSTLLHGLSYASQVTRGKLSAIFSGPRNIRRVRSNGATKPMVLGISAGATEMRAEIEPDDNAPPWLKYRVTLKSGSKSESWTSPGRRPDPPLYMRPESRLFSPSVLLKFRAESLAAPSEIVEGQPRLSFDGYGLPTVLAHLATTDPPRLQQLVNAVKQIVPSVLETRQTLRRWEPLHADAREARSTPTFQYQLEVNMEGSGWVPADLLSEGTLFAFGLHAVLQQRIPPRILLMDDIDRGLHPKAQRTLVQQLANIAATERVQIVVSTHSPYVLDEVPPEAVRVVRAHDGRTQVRSLIEHPEWQNWKSSMTSGEFWTYVGEDWLERAP